MSDVKLLFNNTEKYAPYFTLRYNADIGKKLSFRLYNVYGSKYYYSRNYGRNYVNADIQYDINRSDYIQLIFRNTVSNGVKYYPDSVSDNLFGQTGSLRLNYATITATGIRLNFEPAYVFSGINSYSSYNPNAPFKTQGLKINTGLRVGNSESSFNPRIVAGYIWVANYDNTYKNINKDRLENRPPVFNAEFLINVRLKHLGAYLNYYYGPYIISQHFTNFYYELPFNSIRIMPYYENFIYKDILKIIVRGSYLNDLESKNQRINTTTELLGYLKNDFTLSLLNTINYQKSFIGDPENEDIYKYNSTFFEFRIKKEFNWNQPRFKYHDLKMVFYKDLNGNLKKDNNEPGMKDILVNIKRIETEINRSNRSEYKGQFVNTTLLSDFSGSINFENIIEGTYDIEFNNVGQVKGRFSSSRNKLQIDIKQNEVIYIPFLEHNKIYGKIIMNRSKLSNLGKIDVSNIKIKAIDSQGNESSTLSDNNGNFVIFAPSVDRYIVSINNIFYEHFDLQQNNYLVQLNGYKQFEVNFIFNEKRREINFSPSFSPEDISIKAIKRTNLTGTVRDESTLSSLLAKIEVVNNTTGDPVTTVHSDRNNGRFSTSFITGNNYSLIISKEGYWMYSEKLKLDQLTTIQDIKKDVILKDIIIGSKFELKNLKYAPGSSEIPTEAYPELERLVGQLVNNPNIKIQIAGHADALETLNNDKISEERAKVLTKYFIENGYSNIEYVGYKDLKPIETNDNESGRSRNRRIEIIIVDK